MEPNKKFPTRKSIRLKNYDYSSAGVYFITICTKNRVNYFWQPNKFYNMFVGTNVIHTNKVPLSKYGRIVQRKLLNISKIYKRISVSSSVIMPNHIHMLLTIKSNMKFDGASMLENTQENVSVARIIKQFKGAVTKEIGFSVWQKNFYDHIVRNEEDLRTIWEYIKSNPIMGR